MTDSSSNTHEFTLPFAESPLEFLNAYNIGVLILVSSLGKGANVPWIDGARFVWKKDGSEVINWPDGSEVFPSKDPNNTNATKG